MSCYTHKWQSYRDHRLCDVTSLCVYFLVSFNNALVDVSGRFTKSLTIYHMIIVSLSYSDLYDVLRL